MSTDDMFSIRLRLLSYASLCSRNVGHIDNIWPISLQTLHGSNGHVALLCPLLLPQLVHFLSVAVNEMFNMVY